MIEIDVTDFVLRGRLGPFHRQMSRREIESIVGPSDDCYPGCAMFGNFGFELANGHGPPCAPQILFPMFYRDELRFKWPDQRFAWRFGDFNDTATIDSLVTSHPEFGLIEPIRGERYPTGQLISVCVPGTGVEVSFESPHADGSPVLSYITAYAQWKTL